MSNEDDKTKKPTHKLRVLLKGSKRTTTVGAAWQRDDGSFSITLDPCVVLSWNDPVTISLFPVDKDVPF